MDRLASYNKTDRKATQQSFINQQRLYITNTYLIFSGRVTKRDWVIILSEYPQIRQRPLIFRWKYFDTISITYWLIQRVRRSVCILNWILLLFVFFFSAIACRGENFVRFFTTGFFLRFVANEIWNFRERHRKMVSHTFFKWVTVKPRCNFCPCTK